MDYYAAIKKDEIGNICSCTQVKQVYSLLSFL